MGKRGGRRRKRAEQWAEKNQKNSQGEANQSDVDLPTSKKSKRNNADENETFATGNENKSENFVEVSLMDGMQRVAACPPLPPPLHLMDKDNEKSESMRNLRRTWNVLVQKISKNASLKPSSIQDHLWPILLETNWNAIGVAPTGSGKTLAYSLPTVVSLSLAKQASNMTIGGGILVLAPTRELVQQVAKVYEKVIKAAKQKESFTVVSIYGGVDRESQKQQLLNKKFRSAGKVLVVVATPGRLLDLIKDTSLPTFQWIVLDEADQLSREGDLGPQVDEILGSTKRDGITRLVLVSATYPEKAMVKFQEWTGTKKVLIEIDPFKRREKSEPTAALMSGSPSNEDREENKEDEKEHKLRLSKSRSAAGTYARIPAHLEQVLHVCSEHKKPRKLLHTLHQIYSEHKGSRSLPLGMVFFSKIDKLKYVSKLLDKEETVSSVELHSQLPSAKLREQNLAKFACGQKPLLLATDLAARGIDIPSVQFVIQYDFPGNLQQYVHRCGRAGRRVEAAASKNKKATIYSFFTRNLKPMAPDLIGLLEANDAWVDPNLRALVDEAGTKAAPPKNKKQSNSRAPSANKSVGGPKGSALGKAVESDDDDDDDDFPELSANRIVLKRASHVSDASSSSSEEDEDED